MGGLYVRAKICYNRRDNGDEFLNLSGSRSYVKDGLDSCPVLNTCQSMPLKVCEAYTDID